VTRYVRFVTDVNHVTDVSSPVRAHSLGEAAAADGGRGLVDEAAVSRSRRRP
jgi:hypothetical protein